MSPAPDRAVRPPRVLLALVLLVLATSARSQESAYHGEARDEQGTLLYTERHTVRSGTQGLVASSTEYFAPDGALIATLRSDYSRSVALPTYVFEDLRRDYREGLRWQDGRYVVFHQTGRAPEKSAPLRHDRDVFSCQGWHYYLIDNLSRLEKDHITLDLVLPSELRPYSFVVSKLASNESRVAAELGVKHWLVRQFTPRMRLEYDRQNRRLVEYRGPSNLPTPTGARQMVTIRYYYHAD